MSKIDLTKQTRDVGGKRACVIPTKCSTPRSSSFKEMMDVEWEEFVIRYDAKKAGYVTRTACCPGAPICC